ncbi:flagellar export protein FliJ, partial [Klebsiella pneumoniae]|nr:flagellar export protein FliJ [Klebsiella pneumoniae]
ERLQQAMTTGMSASDCHNYQRFIGTLDDAIGQQQNVLRQADENLAKGRLYWQQEKRKLNSYDALAQREMRAQAVVESRREQRANDEYSARLVQRQAGMH